VPSKEVVKRYQLGTCASLEMPRMQHKVDLTQRGAEDPHVKWQIMEHRLVVPVSEPSGHGGPLCQRRIFYEDDQTAAAKEIQQVV
jgi:hypothetical protein